MGELSLSIVPLRWLKHYLLLRTYFPPVHCSLAILAASHAHFLSFFWTINSSSSLQFLLIRSHCRCHKSETATALKRRDISLETLSVVCYNQRRWNMSGQRYTPVPGFGPPAGPVMSQVGNRHSGYDQGECSDQFSGSWPGVCFLNRLGLL
jgi:hypothetical protein